MQAAAHAAADAAFAAGMRRHQSDPVNVPQRLGELSGALIASLSSPNPHRAIAAAAAAEQQGLAQGTTLRLATCELLCKAHMAASLAHCISHLGKVRGSCINAEGDRVMLMGCNMGCDHRSKCAA